MEEYDFSKLKIALVHDYLQWHGGAEKVLEALHELFPKAPVYTSVYNSETMPDFYKSWDIRTSFMQKLPWWSKCLKQYSFLYPMAFEQFDFSEYDLVISSSAGFAKGIITKPETMHISYIHTPPRFQWGYQTSTREKLDSFTKNIILPPIDNYLRIWDQCAAKRVDYFICNSNEVKKRIKKFYRKDAFIINPPVEIERFESGVDEKENYFITVSRLERYKNIDLIIKAFNKLGLDYKLKIIGIGADEKYLKSLANSNIEFCGKVSDEKLAEFLKKSKGFVFAAEEDFGIAMVEALLSKTPVIAYGKAGALEIVKDGENGILFDELTEISLMKAIENFDKINFNLNLCRETSLKFSKQNFKDKVLSFIQNKLREYYK